MSYKLVSADCDYDSGYTDGYHEGYKDGSNYIECGCDGCTFEDVEEWEMPCLKCKRNCKDYYKSIGVRAMTIDEALQILEHETAFDVRWCDEHRCGTALKLVCNELKIALEKLQWYKSQDLIRREDAIGEIEYECNCYQSEMLHRETIIDVINQIPIAEYRGDDNDD